MRRTAADEAHVDPDGECIGVVYARNDIPQAERRVFVTHLHEDPRGPVCVRDRHRIRDVAQQRVDFHPL